MPTYPITPVPAPRQVKSDLWKPRPMVLRYRAFKDEVRDHGVDLPDNSSVIFTLPMPQSWPKKKKQEHAGQPHKKRPDIDNLFKALADAIHEEDSHLSNIHMIKRWGYTGSIEVRP